VLWHSLSPIPDSILGSLDRVGLSTDHKAHWPPGRGLADPAGRRDGSHSGGCEGRHCVRERCVGKSCTATTIHERVRQTKLFFGPLPLRFFRFSPSIVSSGGAKFTRRLTSAIGARFAARKREHTAKSNGQSASHCLCVALVNGPVWCEQLMPRHLYFHDFIIL
jgi:hypothetical protein